MTFGNVLRDLRRQQGLTQRDLAARCGSHHTHISRLERGEDRAPSQRLLDRLAAALGPDAGARLASAAARLTAAAERAVSCYPRAAAEPALARRTVPALERIEAIGVADDLLRGVPRGGEAAGRIEPAVICRALRLREQSGEGDGPAVSFDGDTIVIRDPGDATDSGAAARRRFLLAHALAHVRISRPACTFPLVGDGRSEEMASAVASCILCPPALLDRALQSVRRELEPDQRNPWSPQAGAIVSAVADRLGVPAWIAIRRLADEELLDEDALYYSWGETA